MGVTPRKPYVVERIFWNPNLTGKIQALLTTTRIHQVVAVGSDLITKVWQWEPNSPSTPTTHQTLLTHHQSVWAASPVGGEGRFVTVSSDGTAKVWDPTTPSTPPLVLSTVWRPNIPTTPLMAVASGPNKDQVAAGALDGVIHLWEEGRYLTKLVGVTQKIMALQFLTNDLLVSGDVRGHVRLWNLRTNESVQSLVEHLNQVHQFLWLEDKQTLYSLAGDRQILEWKLEQRLTEEGDEVSHHLVRSATLKTRIFPKAMALVGDTLVVGGKKGELEFWDIRERQRKTSTKIADTSTTITSLATAGPTQAFLGTDSGAVLLLDISSSHTNEFWRQRMMVPNPDSLAALREVSTDTLLRTFVQVVEQTSHWLIKVSEQSFLTLQNLATQAPTVAQQKLRLLERYLTGTAELTQDLCRDHLTPPPQWELWDWPAVYEWFSQLWTFLGDNHRAEQYRIHLKKHGRQIQLIREYAQHAEVGGPTLPESILPEEELPIPVSEEVKTKTPASLEVSKAPEIIPEPPTGIDIGEEGGEEVVDEVGEPKQGQGLLATQETAANELGGDDVRRAVLEVFKRKGGKIPGKKLVTFEKALAHKEWVGQLEDELNRLVSEGILRVSRGSYYVTDQYSSEVG